MKKSLMLGSIGVVALIASVEWRFGARVAGAVDQEVEATHGGLNVDRPVLQRMAEAAAKTYEATQASYDVGTEVMSNVYVWSRRWLEAERALAETDAEELAALRAHRQRMKRLMLIVRALHVTGTKGGEMEKFYATKFYLAEADAWLATAKNRGRDTPTPLKKVAVSFRGPKGMDVRWDENNDGQFDAEPVVCPARHEFLEGGIYFLQFSGFGGIKLKATLEVLAATDEIVSFEIDVGEVKKIAGGERMSKVYFASDQSGVEEVTGWDDLRDSLVAETERHHTVLVVLHISG